ncbi:MAG: NAD-dependent epimerase/dehydratase family protein, partial [Dehalococcoidia bacterium]|nr:NAD-dependent epimerase/dehydratase family protein [Dehalococcoidia bacterium]
VYGPGLRRNIIFDITEALATEKDFTLSVDPESQYDFIYVDDVVRALLQASSKDWANKTVNISTGRGVTAGSVLELAGKYADRKTSGISFTNGKVVRKVYLNHLASELGWRPQYGFEEGLKKVVEHRLAKGRAHGS